MGWVRWGSFSLAGILLLALTLIRSLQCATCSKGMWLFILLKRLGLTERQENSTGEKKNNQEIEAKSSISMVNAVDCKSRKGTRTPQSCKPLRPSKGWTGV